MKINVLFLFGGQSSEHEVSCRSAVNVIRAADPERFHPVLVGITRDGRWLLTERVEDIEDGSWKESRRRAVLSPDAEEKALFILDGERAEKIRIDAAFPVLHGLWGEDGTVQGIFELARIPYVGCGVLASSVSMDKLYTKMVVAARGIRQAEFEGVTKDELRDMDRVAERVEAHFSYPVFIKPCNAGSSCGVSRADNRKMLEEGLRVAAEHDRKILVEEMIRGREIECAVFGGGDTPVKAYGVGEILAAAEFYDYDAKYNNPDSKTVVEPRLPEGIREKVMEQAEAVFDAVDGYGLSRVDFFVTDDGDVIFNEINTMPGFTGISMYPMIMDAAGVERRTLVTRLIEHGLKRYAR